ncbi:hypothetical protein SKAU_G00002240 [Synaphobranchus kaupii]|uniref:C-type lectin domain-containing protein n=1 Tax=Synaphobranchus kaupii TaxID=118154 RepID=A0A9Q1G9L6_SYNKA|nr:hypothetical protein SKAU_G00002240 [Synaphobranchus kaupii]
MDSNGYDQFNGPEQENNHSGQKIVLCRGRRLRLTYVLYGILLLLLLILLLMTGVKFAQLHQEVADIKLLLVSLDSSLVEPLKKLSNAEAYITELLPTHHKHKAPEQGPCDEGWLFFQGSCYLLSSERANWHTARDKCIDQMADLLVINNADEQDFIADVIHSQSYWIGLVELAEEGHWSWVDGTDFLTTPHFWHVGQPDEWNVPVNGEDCGHIKRNMNDLARWNDADCSLNHLFVCEQKGK